MGIPLSVPEDPHGVRVLVVDVQPPSRRGDPDPPPSVLQGGHHRVRGEPLGALLEEVDLPSVVFGHARVGGDDPQEAVPVLEQRVDLHPQVKGVGEKKGRRRGEVPFRPSGDQGHEGQGPRPDPKALDLSPRRPLRLPFPTGRDHREKSTTTAVWSEGRSSRRSSLSTKAPVEALARGEVAKKWSMRHPMLRSSARGTR